MSTAIEVQGLQKRFGQVEVLRGIDFQIQAGECVGILGPNGAGKTTTLEILEGLQPASGGTVRLLGKSWSDSRQELLGRIGIQLQETRYNDRNTVEETLRVFRSFYPRGLDLEEALRLVQLEEKRDAWVVKLSGGQRQRLALAVALISDPEILFLDEPTTGLDPQSRRALWEVIQLLKQQRRTILITTHYMEEAHVLCDRLLVFDQGRVIAEGTPAALIAAHGGGRRIDLEVDPPLAEGALLGVPGVVSYQPHPTGGGMVFVEDLHQTVPRVLAVVAQAGARPTRLATYEPTLDDVYLRLTHKSLREIAAT